MFSAVNNNEKSMFIHVLKNGGTYVKNVLSKYYKFGGTISIDLKNSARIRSPISDRSMYVSSLLLIYTSDRYKDYNKFAFTRDPYTKFISGVNFIQKTSTTENPNRQIPINEKFIGMTINNFITDKDNLPINMYNHIFITQTNVLYFENALQVNSLYKFENLTEDIATLTKTFVNDDYGVVDYLNDPELKKNESVNETPFYLQYDEAIFNFVNEWFADDFTNFGYTKFNTFQDFLNHYSSK